MDHGMAFGPRLLSASRPMVGGCDREKQIASVAHTGPHHCEELSAVIIAFKAITIYCLSRVTNDYKVTVDTVVFVQFRLCFTGMEKNTFVNGCPFKRFLPNY